MRTLSEKLNPIVKEKKTTLAEVAKKIGISRQQLSNISQRSIIDGGVLNDIAKALGVPTNYFDEFRNKEVVQLQTATHNDNSSVNQSIGGQNDMKELYERLLAEKDEQIKFLKELVAHLNATK